MNRGILRNIPLNIFPLSGNRENEITIAPSKQTLSNESATKVLPMGTPERRKMERFPLKLKASLTTPDTDVQTTFTETITRDICAGGAFLQVDQPLPVGTSVHIDLILPLKGRKQQESKKSRIKVTGAVTRSMEGGMAVSFSGRYRLTPIPV